MSSSTKTLARMMYCIITYYSTEHNTRRAKPQTWPADAAAARLLLGIKSLATKKHVLLWVAVLQTANLTQAEVRPNP